MGHIVRRIFHFCGKHLRTNRIQDFSLKKLLITNIDQSICLTSYKNYRIRIGIHICIHEYVVFIDKIIIQCIDSALEHQFIFFNKNINERITLR